MKGLEIMASFYPERLIERYKLKEEDLFKTGRQAS